ncbi:MAG: hypothetical protein MOP51_492 [Citricoccus sp.]|nr:hypothetical protein [Citricoccus sp. WCRC_4]
MLAPEDPVIAPSALKGGLDEEGILHAGRNPVRCWQLGDGLVMVLGAGRDAAFLDLGYVEGAEAPVIVHEVPARQKFLR